MIRSVLPALGTTSINLSLVLGMCEGHVWLEFRHDPADDAGEQIITNLSAIAKIDFFEAFCLLHHFEHGRACDVPHALHAPNADTRATRFRELGETLIRNVKTVADVDVAWAGSGKWTYCVDEGTVGNFTVELGEVEVVEDIRACRNGSMPVPRDLPQLHQLVDIQVLKHLGEHGIRQSPSALAARPVTDVRTFEIQRGVWGCGQVFRHH